MQSSAPEPERTVAFIVARLSSSRLPAKQFRTIGDRSLLTWVCDQLDRCRQVDQVVLATVAEPQNRPLQQFAAERGLACFWYEGEVDHVTTRLRRAAETFAADICLLISADCPLIDASAIDLMVQALKQSPQADTVRLLANANAHPAALQGVVAGRRNAWQLADDLSNRPELKEHQFPVIGMRPELFTAVDLVLPETLCMPFHRLSVDTLADLEFMNAVYQALHQQNRLFDLAQVVQLLAEQPDLKAINAHVHQRRLKEEIQKVLLVVDAGGRYGFGHLMRSIELARQITERLGWPTHFMVDDHQAKALIEASGHAVHLGAFERPAAFDDTHRPLSIETIIAGYNLIIVDIFDQRGPEPGWRSRIGAPMAWVVIENARPWAFEADLVVLPNILSLDVGPNTAATAKVVGGDRFIVLRREIQQLTLHPKPKNLDVLVYLHDGEQRRQIEKTLIKMGLKTRVMQSFDPEFAAQLAGAHLFISGFGISFYEALALGTLPICWPDSDAHRRDAEKFYRYLDMQSLIIESPADAEMVLPPLLKNRAIPPKRIQDGTAAIVAEMATLF